jgi:cytochrome P450
LSAHLCTRVVKGLLSLDGAEHHRLRRLVAKAFTPKAAERLRTTCVDVITELVDRHSGVGHCDMVADIARQYPIPIICAPLGTPPEDWHQFSDWADDVFKVFTWNVANDAPDILRAWEQLDAYNDGMVAHRREALTDDLISELIRAEVDVRPLDTRRTADARGRPADGGDRHHAQSTGRRGTGAVRPSRPMGTARRASRTRCERRRGAHALLADHLRHHARDAR